MISAKRYKLAIGRIAFTWNVLQLIEVAYLDSRIWNRFSLFDFHLLFSFLHNRP